MNNTELSYLDLIKALEQQCENKATGTLFITTNTNHSVRFFLQEGHIISLAYRFTFGFNALSFIQKTTSGRFSFKENILSGSKEDNTLPETETLLDTLFGLSMPARSRLNDKKLVSPTHHHNESLQTKTIENNEARSFDAEIAHIKTELSLFMGPIAHFIYDEYIENEGKPSSQQELKQMIDVFSQEMTDKHQEKIFKKNVNDKIS